MMYNLYHPLGMGGGLLGYGLEGLAFGFVGLIVLLIVTALKGYALWHAARRSEQWWFIALLIVNTFGILELIYLYFVVGKWHDWKDFGGSNK